MKDPDYGYSIAGWQGRIVEIDKGKCITIKWDSESIRNMPIESIKKSEIGGYDWREMVLFKTDVESCEARDNPEDADEEISKIEWEHFREDYFPEYSEDEDEEHW